MPNIQDATKSYETWLAKHTTLVEADLALKHQHMAEDLFAFLRATFYRWMQLWPETCPDLTTAPTVLAVGDLHVENFGTWRDREGRLLWGINDFDEASALPYTLDLVRLAASAKLAIAANHLAIEPKDACEAILAGYTEGLEVGGRPFVLGEHHPRLREMALGKLRDPIHFWKKMDDLSTVRQPIPTSAKEALEQFLPERGLSYRIAKRVAGLGSLGRQRFVAIADWRGGRVAREAKALVASAYQWARGGDGSDEILYPTILDHSVRCLDPLVQLQGTWLVRRLAPDCCRIELADIPKERDEIRLLHAMGWEVANIHLGSKNAVKDVLCDLKKRPNGWLRANAKEMVRATTADWEEWMRR